MKPEVKSDIDHPRDLFKGALSYTLSFLAANAKRGTKGQKIAVIL